MRPSGSLPRIGKDVVVVGYGSAGATAAIEAARAGARVLLIEKMKELGGNSLLSAGYLRIAMDAGDATRYLDATCGGRVERAVLAALAQGMTEIIPYLEELARPLNAKVFRNVSENLEERDMDDLYDWPGRETFGWAGIESIPSFDGYPWVLNGGRGQNLLRVLETHVEASSVEVWFDTAATRMVVEDGRVRGLVAERAGETVEITAEGGVILACGGFEFDETMLRDYLELPLIYGTGSPGNAGDGIRLVQQAGAALWHMWHIHGSYGFRFPGVQVAIRNHLGGVRRVQRPVAWILVDQDGKRFMNEVPPTPQDTPVRPMAYMDPETGRFPRIPSWMLFDEEARKLGPVGKPLAAVPEHYYEWSNDNSKEIEQGWILRADTIEQLAAQTKLPQEQLAATIERWNQSVAQARDADFARPAGTMVQLSHPPYHAVQVWPIVTNTQGGPRRDEYQRVIGVEGHPIPGLYAVGELGSVFGHIYMLGGNLAECVVGGRIAGRHAASVLETSGRKVAR